jgi:hypothetical protein
VAAGVPLAIHSDHPAVGSTGRFLMYEAAKSHHWGLPTMAAINSVTSVPAKAMGVADRVGIISKGYDADVVVWDRHPLLMGARPNTVVIDGKVMIENSYPSVAGDPDVVLRKLLLRDAPFFVCELIIDPFGTQHHWWKLVPHLVRSTSKDGS